MRPLLLLCLAGCGRLAFDPLAADGGAGDAGDGSVIPGCQTFGTWTPPIEVTSLSSIGDDWEPALHPDGSLLVFNRDGFGLFSAQRTGSVTFTSPMPIAQFSDLDEGPTWSPSGDRLYFASERTGFIQLWQADYSNGVFQPPTQVLDPEIESATVIAPAISSDELELYWCSGTPTSEILRAERPTRTSPWTVTGVEAQLTIPGGQSGWPTLSTDMLTMYFEGIDANGPKLYVSTRGTRGERFGAPTLLSELGVSTQDDIGDPDLSRDGLTLMSAFQPQAMTTQFDIHISVRSCLD